MLPSITLEACNMFPYSDVFFNFLLSGNANLFYQTTGSDKLECHSQGQTFKTQDTVLTGR